MGQILPLDGLNGVGNAMVDAFDRRIRSLNSDFGLELHAPDPSVSPRKSGLMWKSEEQVRIDAIYRRLRALSFNKNQEHLTHIMGLFQTEARRIMSGWIIKPRADPDLLPRQSNAPLGPRNAEERAALQAALLELLTAPPYMALKGGISSTIKDQEPGQLRALLKRPSDDSTNSVTKYSRSHLSDRSVESHSGIDAIPIRSQEASLDGPLHRPRESFTRTTNSSSLSLHSNFCSISGEGKAQSSQSTCEADPEDGDRRHDASKGLYPSLDHAPGKHLLIKDASFKNSQDAKQPHPGQEDGRLASPTPLPECNISDASVPEFDDFDLPISDAPLNEPVATQSLESRLQNIWPSFPIPALNHAPFAVVWELTRAALHCNVNLGSWDLTYEPNGLWKDQENFRSQIMKHRLFHGYNLPRPSGSKAWTVALDSFQTQDKAVTLAGELCFRSGQEGPLYELKLKPLELDWGHRLIRRFGSDRFLEITMPSPTATREQPSVIKYDSDGPGKIVRWLHDKPHYFLGRVWVPFFTRKLKVQRQDFQSSDKPRSSYAEKVCFFAVDGNDFRRPPKIELFPPLEEARTPSNRTKLKISGLLNWAIAIQNNSAQSVPKLFSRIALNLSQTRPTIELERCQILILEQDIGTHNCMNDGIGRMSHALARLVTHRLALREIPGAFQARLGSAKGMWVKDVTEDERKQDIWIEIYPSQRKWKCDFNDVKQRTFEVQSWSRPLKTATLNQQFTPVLEARASNPMAMRMAIAQHLENGLKSDFEQYQKAMDHPISLRLLLHQSSSSTPERLVADSVQFSAALPADIEKRGAYLLDSGFQPKKNRFLLDSIWKVLMRRSERLIDKMHISIPRSSYVYMVADFWGVLEEGEISLSFSSKFLAGDFFKTRLENMDVLVARAPAHFASDIQKVRAVSRWPLRDLEDVIVFSTKGETPLADILSGGDYDGDLAWVCWDQDIVENFRNAPAPPKPNLLDIGYLRSFNPSVEDTLARHDDLDEGVKTFLHQAFSFNMEQSLLGSCTVYKEKLCYHHNSIDSQAAVIMSTLLSDLVDQSKQGIVFTHDDWDRLRTDMIQGPKHFSEPMYNRIMRSQGKPLTHVLDWLKFDVAKTAVEELRSGLWKYLDMNNVPYYDEDLAAPHSEFEEEARKTKENHPLNMTCRRLQRDIRDIEQKWHDAMKSSNNFEEPKLQLHQEWLKIEPPADAASSKVFRRLFDSWTGKPALSKWALIKASAMHRLCYKSNLVWWLAGAQLCETKARRTCSVGQGGGSSSSMPVLVVPTIWAMLKPDKKLIEGMAAKRLAAADGRDWEEETSLGDYDIGDEGTMFDSV